MSGEVKSDEPKTQDYPKGVYISASSSEIERAKKWMNALREKDIPVISTWIEVIEKTEGGANPRDASLDDRQKWCKTDLREALGSAVLWLLMPIEKHSFGATFEFAAYVVLSNEHVQNHVVSGDWRKSIFTSFSACFDTDEEAFAQIVEAFEHAKL